MEALIIVLACLQLAGMLAAAVIQWLGLLA